MYNDNDINKSIIDAILTNYNYDELYNQFAGDWDAAYKYLYNQVIGAFNDLSDSDTTKVKTAWNNLLSIDTNAALEENIPKIEAYIKQIADLLDIDWTQLAPALGYDIDASKKQIQDLKDRMGYSHKSGYALSNKESDVNQKINDLTQGLTQEDLDVLVDVELPSNILDMTEEEFKAWLKKLQDESTVNVRTSLDTATDLKTVNEAFQKLGGKSDGLYADTKAGKQGDSSDIANLSDSFGTVSNGYSLEKFASVLETLPGDTKAAQDAFDDLTTAFLDQSNVLDDITEAQADYIKQQLKEQGIDNADEFVKSRLNKQVKENIKAINQYSSAVSEYAKTLLTTQEGDDGYNEALEGMRSGFEELYNSINSFKDENENPITIPISTDFAKRNLTDLMNAANGSTEALNRLQIAAAKEYVANLTARFPANIEEEMNAKMYSLMDTIQSQVKDVEVGAYIDDTQAISALNNLIRAAGGTQGDVNNILSQMGVDAEIIKQTVPMEQTGTFIDENGHPHTTRYKQNVELASIHYKRRAGSGSGAHYSGTSKSSSGGSGGSGGGGGGSSSEPQEEVFDWIEVAINRAEEQISRLDKVVENTYDKWTNRSKALNDEISKTSDEIKLQQQAYQGYIDKANSIGLSDSYKQKVQNGTIQIETVTDEDLKTKISDYQTWYNKAVECQDKIQELNISLSELAKKKFDNIVTQFEDMEKVFTDTNDILDKLVDYAETKGRIISKSYYEAMLQNENENNKLLVQQRDQMVAELNNMLNSSSVSQDSEALNDLKQQIDEINGSIVESNKSIQEFYNNMRQADWDLFDLVQDKITGVADEIEFVQSLLDDRDNLTDGHLNRGLTNEGLAQLGNYASKYNIYMSQAEKYANEIKKIEADITKDPANQDLIDRKEELVKAQRDVILSANDERKSMIDLARDGYDAVLEVLQDLIDKKKEALSSTKELYEYQKDIASKTKDLATLEKEASVYENDNSEEALKKVQQIKVDIESKKQELSDAEYDKYIEDQEKMLDDLYQEYSDKIDEKFEQTEILIQELIGVVNENQSSISDTITTVTSDVGYTISDQMKTIWNDAGTVIAGFTGKFDTYATTVQSAINSIQVTIDKMLQIAQAEANNNIATANNPSGDTTSTKNYIVQSSIGDYIDKLDLTDNEKKSLKDAFELSGIDESTDRDLAMAAYANNQLPVRDDTAKFYMDWLLSKGRTKYAGDKSWGFSGLTQINYSDTPTLSDYIDQLDLTNQEKQTLKEAFTSTGIDPSTITRDLAMAAYTTGTLPQHDEFTDWAIRYLLEKGRTKEIYDKSWGSFKNGTSYMKDEYGWTQDGGTEIIRRADGAILTPVGHGGMVFDNEMSKNLWNIAKQNPEKFYQNAMPTMNTFATTNRGGDVSVSIGDIKLDGIQNPDQFAQALIGVVKDYSKVQKVLQAATVDLVAGKSIKGLNKF